MEFFETVMGKQFYTSTMPSIAKSLQAIAAKMKAKECEKKYILIKHNNYNNQIEVVEQISSKGKKKVFESLSDIKAHMSNDLIATFNSMGLEDEIIASVEEIQARGYYVEISDDDISIKFAAREAYDDPEMIYWTILEI